MIRRDSCRYCGVVAHGYGCYHSPDNLHVEEGDSEHCIYCGSTSYGSSCIFSPEGIHKHGHGERKCVWCGIIGSSDSTCIYSSSGKHQF